MHASTTGTGRSASSWIGPCDDAYQSETGAENLGFECGG